MSSEPDRNSTLRQRILWSFVQVGTFVPLAFLVDAWAESQGLPSMSASEGKTWPLFVFALTYWMPAMVLWGRAFPGDGTVVPYQRRSKAVRMRERQREESQLQN